jgi:hypothetical protein
VDELHHRLIHIGLDALAEDYGYALAGGYAIQTHHIVQRISDDVDLFAPFERAKEEMPDAAARVIAAYEAAGYRVELAQQVDTYTRLNITDPDTGTFSKVELVAEFLHHPPVDSDLGPVLHPDDLAAGKTGALFSRAEVRDAIDIDGLLKAGYSTDRLMELAAQNDLGFDRRMFADSLARVQRYSDKQFAAYSLDANEAAAIRQRFAEWHRQLTHPEATADGTAARPAAPNRSTLAVGRNTATEPASQPPDEQQTPLVHNDNPDHGRNPQGR